MVIKTLDNTKAGKVAGLSVCNPSRIPLILVKGSYPVGFISRERLHCSRHLSLSEKSLHASAELVQLVGMRSFDPGDILVSQSHLHESPLFPCPRSLATGTMPVGMQIPAVLPRVVNGNDVTATDVSSPTSALHLRHDADNHRANPPRLLYR